MARTKHQTFVSPSTPLPFRLLPHLTAFISRHTFILFIITFFILQLIALSYFVGGFFLTRYELPISQTCQIPQTLEQIEAVVDRLKLKQVDERSQRSLSQLQVGGCWYPRQYDRVIILLVDALRFDFIHFNTSMNLNEPRAPYLNELPIVSTLLASPTDASHTSLFRFVADPPTVTMQRIKGLTTGGLPTFIDIKDNFGGAAIQEDNWIAQLKHTQRVKSVSPSASVSTADRANIIHFFGDDTWFDLYPPQRHFSSQSKAYPSFNVKDLHTVDDGCRSNLEPLLSKEMERLEQESKLVQGNQPQTSESTSHPDDEWDVILAHFLGVDHVGHRYGPNHPEMKLKLAQMNEVITKNVEFVRKQRQVNHLIRQQPQPGPDSPSPQEVLFIVMGDHGMTEDGNHGGQTPEEIYSGLFMFSTKTISQRRTNKQDLPRTSDEGRILEEIRGKVLSDLSKPHSADSIPFALPPLSTQFTSFLSIPQIDFVPSISLLLGLPIPFGNVGKIIPELFWNREESQLDTSTDQSEEGQKRHILIQRLSSFLPLLQALRLNALQIFQYFHVYSMIIDPKTFGLDVLTEVSREFVSAEELFTRDKIGEVNQSILLGIKDLSELRRLEQVYTQTARTYYSYLYSSAEIAKNKWTAFNYPYMYQGLIFSCTIVITIGAYIWSESVFGAKQPASSYQTLPSQPMYDLLLNTLAWTGKLCLPCLPSIFFSYLPSFIQGDYLWFAGMVVMVSGIYLIMKRYLLPSTEFRSFFLTLRPWSNLTFETYVAILVTVLYVQGQFSNMFIENEASVAWYSAILLAASWCYIGPDSAVTVESTIGTWKRCGWLAVLLISMRVMGFAATSTAPDANYQDTNKYSSYDIGFMIGTLILLPIISAVSAKNLLNSLSISSRTNGRMRIYSLIHNLLVPIAFSLIFIFWSLPSSPTGTISDTTSQFVTLWRFVNQFVESVLSALGLATEQLWIIRVVLPRCVYTIALVGISLILFSVPQLQNKLKVDDNNVDETDALPPHHNGTSSSFVESDGLPGRRRRDANTYPSENGSSETSSPMEGGSSTLTHDRSTLFALNVHTLLTLVSLPILLVWGPKGSVVLVAVWLVILSFIRLTSSSLSAAKNNDFTYSQLLFLLFLSLHIYYSTGHSNSFSSLQVSCAFIGFDIFNYYIGGILLMLNTFGHILIVVLIAIFVGSIRVREQLKDRMVHLTPSDSLSPPSSPPFYRSLIIWLIFLIGSRTFISTLNVYIQRRHLMVWAIFAPKYMFDAIYNVALGVVSILVVACTTHWTNIAD